MTVTASLQDLEILRFPNPLLKKACAPVAEYNEGLSRLAERMLKLMHEAQGVGLAAPQVGVLIRLFVCNPTGEPNDNTVFVNPSFVELCGAAAGEEGCLSIPGVTVNMRRATHAVMDAFGLDGRAIRVSADDLRARIWQHETDHLDGRLITDHMSAADEIANRRAIKQLKVECAAGGRSRP